MRLLAKPPFATAGMLVAVLAVSAFAGAPACSSSDAGSGFADAAAPPPANDSGVDTGPLQGLTSISVSPPTASLLAGMAPTSQSFTATGHFADGTTRDVTGLVGWTAAPTTLLAGSGATVSPFGAVGGDGTMTAFSGAVSGTAQVHVKLVQKVFAPGAPPGSDAKFMGTVDPALAPAVVYPLAGVLVPPNLDAVELQWLPAAGAGAMFDVAFEGAAIDLHIYTPCNAIGATKGCGLVPDSVSWASVVGTLQGTDPAALTVSAVGTAVGTYGTSGAQSIQFAADDVKGGLYWFNTRTETLADGGTNPPGIYRYDFVKNTSGPFFTQQACAGCHALSKDGTKMLAPICTTARGCGRPLLLAVVDVATGIFVTPPMPVGDSDTQTFSPDNKYYVTTPSCAGYDPNPPNACASYGTGKLVLVDAASNTALNTVPTGPGAIFPWFSGDGARLVYARGSPYNGPLSITGASLYTIDFTPPNWGTEKLLLQSSGENNYYPAFSPDDAWVVYAQSHCNAGDPASACDSYDDPTAKVMVVSAAGGTAIDLAHANGTGSLDNSWPKWSPFAGSYKGGGLFWITFSTMRDYGFRTYDTMGQPTHVRQLWLMGFDVGKAKAGMDPSFAPVWLPFQDPKTSNHIGQWTEKIVGNPK